MVIEVRTSSTASRERIYRPLFSLSPLPPRRRAVPFAGAAGGVVSLICLLDAPAYSRRRDTRYCNDQVHFSNNRMTASGDRNDNNNSESIFPASVGGEHLIIILRGRTKKRTICAFTRRKIPCTILLLLLLLLLQ